VSDKQHLRKIPGNCKVCGEPHSVADMERFLALCESIGEDPVELAHRYDPPGIACVACFARRVAEGLEDGEPRAKKIVSALRADALGLELVNGGKKG
jgi:hypothetical protein